MLPYFLAKSQNMKSRLYVSNSLSFILTLFPKANSVTRSLYILRYIVHTGLY